MKLNELSAKNFKTLRTTYNLSSARLSQLLGMKSNATIVNLENSKSLPSYELLTKYVNLFAVSSDWLMGRSNTPYTEDSVSHAEEQASLLLSINVPQSQHAATIIKFFNDPKRIKSISLDIRANVVFIVNTEIEPLLEIAIKEAEVNNPPPDENPIVTHAKKLQLEFQISKFYSDDNQPKNIVNCMKLITQELKEPIFDVRKNLEK